MLYDLLVDCGQSTSNKQETIMFYEKMNNQDDCCTFYLSKGD